MDLSQHFGNNLEKGACPVAVHPGIFGKGCLLKGNRGMDCFLLRADFTTEGHGVTRKNQLVSERKDSSDTILNV